MVESLVITLREGIEAALVVGIILAYLHKTGRTALNRRVYAGLGAAVAASIVFAALFELLAIDPENEFLEGALLGAAGVMVASLVVWMWRAARHIKEQMERKLSTIVGKESLRGQGIGLLAFTFLMVAREGVETVLFLKAATLDEFTLLNLIGGALGIGLAVLFAVFFIRGSLRINLQRFFAVTSVVLLLLALKLMLGSLHEFAEVGVIPLTKEVMAVIGYFVRDNSSDVILMGLLAVPLLLVLWDARLREMAPQPAQESSVERRKRRALQQRQQVWRLGLVAIALFIISAMGSTVLAGSAFTDPQPTAVAARDGKVDIAVSELPENRLVKYVYDSNGVAVRFLVVRHPDGSVSTALDACQICGKVGYGQEGGNAICKNCNAPILMDTIGQGGGCNPLPLAAQGAGGALFFLADDLAKAEPIFR